GAAALKAIETSLGLDAVTSTPNDSVARRGGSVDPTGAYRLTRYAHRGVENLPSLFSGQLHVRRVSSDTINVLGLGDADGRYYAVAPTRWRSMDGSSMVAVRTKNGVVTHFFGPLSFFGTRFP